MYGNGLTETVPVVKVHEYLVQPPVTTVVEFRVQLVFVTPPSSERPAISVEKFGDRRIFGFLFFVLVEYPFQGRPIAEFVLPRDRGNTFQCRNSIKLDRACNFIGF